MFPFGPTESPSSTDSVEPSTVTVAVSELDTYVAPIVTSSPSTVTVDSSPVFTSTLSLEP